ncbi:hypothetical protein SDC9_01509 [bioreactor metagenome]|uniref:Uncharacterized protein n=1 Tax=bioreactor metagenome TaxID=1076179 RepID=A0A644SP00_9ZZZZ
MSNITTDLESFENIDYPKNIYELLLALKQQPIEINLNNSSQLNYTTDEQLTGENWLDGKPIYRKGFTGISDGEFNDFSFKDICDNLISAKGYLRQSTQDIPYLIGNYETYDYKVEFQFEPTESLMFRLKEKSINRFTPHYYAISLEYTKK